MEPIRTIRGPVVPLVRDDIDTDQVVAARYMKTTDREGLGQHCFGNWRYAADGSPRPDFVLNQPGMAGRPLLLAGANFGSGSSREHAVWALQSCGFQAVLARSFADIFRSNALKNGLLPVPLPDDVHARLVARLATEPDCPVTVDLEAERVELPDDPAVPLALEPFVRRL
ncbi:MAG TPA: 3-isopropylmalate dehydratase small subunit, partial [Candidatus Dormibacteraeota bacterium]|nr:3-isopropylmalate dehydratase small subunit [Candidatus Dormibacteraeota bacterium]